MPDAVWYIFRNGVDYFVVRADGLETAEDRLPKNGDGKTPNFFCMLPRQDAQECLAKIPQKKVHYL